MFLKMSHRGYNNKNKKYIKKKTETKVNLWLKKYQF